jgi:hypothetical protein
VTERRSKSVAIAAAATLLATVFSSCAITHAQWGPTWEVPAFVVTELALARLASFLLLPLAIGLLLWSARTARRPLALIPLAVQLVLSVSMAILASPDKAAQWPGTSPQLSRCAGVIAFAAALVSAFLGTFGAMIWRCSASAQRSGT